MTSQAVSKGPCPECGSSDGNVSYDDGHTFCFVCKKHKSGMAAKKQRGKARTSGLIEDMEYQDLTRRRITVETCRHWGYGVAEYNDKSCHVARYYDKDGNEVAQKIRLPGKEFLWTGEPKKALLFGQHLWKPDPRVRVVVCEGEIDALSMSQVQGNEWPVLSVKDGAGSATKGFKENLEYLMGFKEVVLCFDNDKPGQEAAKECAALLPPGKVRIMRLRHKDANEYLTKDDAKNLLEDFWNAPVYRPDGVIDSDSAWEKMVQEQEQEKLVGRIPFRQPILQESWGGRRMGGVYIYGAGTGAGKSTEFREDAVFVMGLGYKVGYIALEETIGQTLQSFLSILCNKLDPTLEEQKAAFDKIRGKFFLYDHFSQRDISGLMAKIRYMVVAEGCNIVYLDHMTAVIVASETEEDRVATDHFMGSVSALAVELKVPIMVVSHLSRREKTNHEGGDQITLKDFRGSHSIPQYATGVIGIERDQQADQDSEVDVSVVRRLKHRWRGRLGQADTMHYSHKSGRYLPAQEAALQETGF